MLHYTANNIGKKVKYSSISRNAHSGLLKDAFLKLEMSRIIHLVRHTRSTKVPLTQMQDNEVFKPVFMDIGLVNHLSGIKLIDIENLITSFEGTLAEQFVLQEFIASGEPYKARKRLVITSCLCHCILQGDWRRFIFNQQSIYRQSPG